MVQPIAEIGNTNETKQSDTKKKNMDTHEYWKTRLFMMKHG